MQLFALERMKKKMKHPFLYTNKHFDIYLRIGVIIVDLKSNHLFELQNVKTETTFNNVYLVNLYHACKRILHVGS